MQQTEAASVQNPGGFYEELPYDSMPFAHTQPAHLAALAQLFGHSPPTAASARVLELGCASGGNILPLAARFPQARFTGIDLSSRHVSLGRERIAALGLGNIDIRQGDLADPQAAPGEFDYIICHGVYSWVPPAAQQGILEICGKQLAQGGVAYISYNVLPGWQLRKIVRDIFLFHTGGDGDGGADPRERVAKGRWLLEQLASVSPETTPYGQLLRREAKQLANMGESYILGEFLAEENAPCYFHEFLARAERAGLAYVTDTDLHTSLPENVSPELKQVLLALAGPDPRMAEQYFDFFQGRQFRQSLLVRAADAPKTARSPEPRNIAGLHFASNLRLDSCRSKDGALVLREPGDRTIATNDPLVAAALDHLGACMPETRDLGQILDHLKIAEAGERQAAAERIAASLLRIVIAGLATMSTVPVRTGRASDVKPSVWRVARQDAATDQPWTTSLRHLPVRLDGVAKAMLQLVDGRNDRAALTRRLAAFAQGSSLEAAPEDGDAERSGASEDASADLAARVELVLQQLDRLALLEPTG